MIKDASAKFARDRELNRAHKPEEVAPAVVFLASEQASLITGANLLADGGSAASI